MYDNVFKTKKEDVSYQQIYKIHYVIEKMLILILICIAEEGEVYCLYTIISGSTYYTSVLNPGFVDQTKYHRFTCLVRFRCFL